MNHYELIFIVNPQQSKESKLFDKCKDQISAVGGELHRAEDIGLRDLAYQIDDCSKGHYFLLNFECEPNNLKEIETLFKFNESILRSSIVKKRRAETEASALMSQTKDKQTDFEKPPLEEAKKEEKKITKTEEKEVIEDKETEGKEETSDAEGEK
jgi:small subunit ribosomal protein S6